MENNTHKDNEPKSTSFSHRRATPDGVEVTEIIQRQVGATVQISSAGEVNRKLSELRNEVYLKTGDTLKQVEAYVVIGPADATTDSRRTVVAAHPKGFDVYQMTCNEDGAMSVVEGGFSTVDKGDAKSNNIFFQPGSHLTYAVKGAADRLYDEDSTVGETPPELEELDAATEAIEAYRKTHEHRQARARGARALRFFSRDK